MQALYKRALSEAPGFQESEKSDKSVINKNTVPFLIEDSSDCSGVHGPVSCVRALTSSAAESIKRENVL